MIPMTIIENRFRFSVIATCRNRPFTPKRLCPPPSPLKPLHTGETSSEEEEEEGDIGHRPHAPP